MNITPKMIEAGKAAYWGHFSSAENVSSDCFANQITAIYEAMCAQKQKDALEEYKKCFPVNSETHSHR